MKKYLLILITPFLLNSIFAQAPPVSLTPPAPPAPRINGPAVFGVRPGSPVIYNIPATGTRPVTFEAENLPKGLTVNAGTGIITGALKARGEYTVTLKAANKFGSAQKKVQNYCWRPHRVDTTNGLEQLERIWRNDYPGKN